MSYKRDSLEIVRRKAGEYPVLAILGPRQSGKSTLCTIAFPDKKYLSLENPDARAFALKDPKGFLDQFPEGGIIDEAQYAPELFSYIQTIIDQKKKDGMFILTGSQNFNLMEKISQSLAGRVSIHKLLPFSLHELKVNHHPLPSLNEMLFTGGYPRIYDKKLFPTDWLANYVETYLDRDVRLLKNIGDLSTFHLFIKMCASRSGQLLNLTSLGNDCGISHTTAKQWLSVLETSFIVYLLQPHFKNFDKRLKKSPKLYFYDTGLLCYLLSITKAEDLAHHSQRGAIFETFVIGEMIKQRLHASKPQNLYFWQDKKTEVDCLIDHGDKLIPVEIKSAQTIANDFFNGLNYWNKISSTSSQGNWLVYGGIEDQKRSAAQILGWQSLDKLPL